MRWLIIIPTIFVVVGLIVLVVVLTHKKHGGKNPPQKKCDSTHPCPSGFICNSDGKCVHPTPPLQCDSKTPCPPGYTCNTEKKCVMSSCDTNHPCPDGFICNSENVCQKLDPSICNGHGTENKDGKCVCTGSWLGPDCNINGNAKAWQVNKVGCPYNKPNVQCSGLLPKNVYTPAQNSVCKSVRCQIGEEIRCWYADETNMKNCSDSNGKLKPGCYSSLDQAKKGADSGFAQDVSNCEG